MALLAMISLWLPIAVVRWGSAAAAMRMPSVMHPANSLQFWHRGKVGDSGWLCFTALILWNVNLWEFGVEVP